MSLLCSTPDQLRRGTDESRVRAGILGIFMMFFQGIFLYSRARDPRNIIFIVKEPGPFLGSTHRIFS